MNNASFLSLCFLLFTLTTTGLSQEEAIHFQSGRLEEFKAEAAREGKPVFVHFTASWCMPCQWMETNTYSDRQLADYINQYFLPVKVDIDEREGYRAKQEYRIILLPSVLIIDTRGLVVGRYEESMNASRLLYVLQQYGGPAGSEPIIAGAGPELSAPARPELIVRPALVPENDITTPSSPPRRVNTTAMTNPPAPASPSYSPPRRVNSTVMINPPASTPPPSSPPRKVSAGGMPSTDNGSLGMSASPPRKVSAAMPAESSTSLETTPTPSAAAAGRYSIQVGVFSSYENALRQMEDLKNKVAQPVKVFVGNMQGATIYRLLIGSFELRSDAETFLSQLRQSTITGMVKDLSEL